MQVRVHIIEAIKLAPADSNGLADPICYVSIGNKCRKTKQKYKTLECLWDQQFVFELPNKSQYYKTCIFNVYDSDLLNKKLIGTTSLNLDTIYSKSQHSLINTWIALTGNPNTTGISSYLRFSISVLDIGDSLPVYVDEISTTDDNTKDIQSLILIPPYIIYEESTLLVRIYEGKEFPNKDVLSKNDTYVEVLFGNNKTRTTTVQNSSNPEWNTEMIFPTIKPCFYDSITIKVKDQDLTSKDTLIAETKVSYNEIEKCGSKIEWIYFYDDNSKEYLGKLLAEFIIVNEKNKLETRKISSRSPPTEIDIPVVFDIYELSELPIQNGLLKLELSVGTKKVTVAVLVKNYSAHVYQQLKLNVKQPLTNLQKILFKIYNGSVFLDGIELSMNENKELNWYHYNFNILSQLHFNKLEVPQIKKPKIKTCQLSFQMFGAYNIKSSKCNQYSLKFGSRTFWSAINKTPWWNEFYTLTVELPELLSPPVIISLYDTDRNVIDSFRININDNFNESPVSYTSENGSSIVMILKYGLFKPITLNRKEELCSINLVSLSEIKPLTILPIKNLNTLINGIVVTNPLPTLVNVPVTIIGHPLFKPSIYVELYESNLIGINKLLGCAIISIDLNKVKNLPALTDQMDYLTIIEEDTNTIVDPEGIEDTENDDIFDRKTYNNELEKHLTDIPFESHDIYRNGSTIGKLKLHINNSNQKITNKKVITRIYILNAENLNPFTGYHNNSADPYIIIKRGEETLINDKQNAIKRNLSPDFYSCYELETNTVDTLSIQVWDANSLFDDFIGGTKIELEDRFFSGKWRKMTYKPIEKRTLWDINTELAQGTINLWIEMLTPEQAKRIPKTAIMPRFPLECELRVIIWRTKNVKFRDENMSDIYVTGILAETSEEQRTDTHWRSMNGKGEFNWRMIYDVQIPGRYPRFKVQIWDRDIFHRNQSIAEATINLKGIFKKMYRENRPIQRLPKQWIDLTDPRTLKLQGSIEMSIEILTKLEANRMPVGKGRNEPDALPTPNRPSSSFNPLRFDKYIVEGFWERQKSKIYLSGTICCTIFILIVAIYIFK